MRLATALFAVTIAACAAHTETVGVDAGADLVDDLSRGDAASADAAELPSLELVVPCNDSLEQVYLTPTGLPALDAAHQGDLLRCAADHALDLDGAGVDAVLAGEGIALGAPASGVAVYRVAFRTFRGDGREGASTARVYVPTAPRALPLPVFVAGHPTEGMGDACASSRNPSSLRDLALPWAARGYAIIAPDYAGFGNEGVAGYLDNRDQGHSILDGARALRKLFVGSAMQERVVLAGFSQGGGAVLSAQALAKTYGAGGTLAAVVAFSPEWPIRYNSFAFVDMLRNPDTLIAYDLSNLNLSYGNHVIWTQRAYAYFANFSTITTDGGAGFPAARKATFLSDMDSICGEVGIGAAIYVAAHPPFGAHNGDLFDSTFRTSLVACIDDPADPACTGFGKDFYQHLGANHLSADGKGAPVLYVQGLVDTVLPPAKEAACIVAKLQADGLSPQVCVDALAQHTSVTPRNMAYAIGWVEALLAGATAPACPAATALPAGSCD